MSTHSVQKTIGIVGCAIAGPVFALQILAHPTLRKAYKPILFDRIPNPKYTSETDRLQSGGAAIGLFPNGLYPLFQLGLQHALDRHGVETPLASFWSATGKDFNRSQLSYIATSDYVGYEADIDRSVVIIEREALRAILIDEVEKKGGEVFWDCALKKVERLNETKVRVTFEGSSTTPHDLDLLVGADGAFSTIRRYLLEEINIKTGRERWMPDHCGMTGIYSVTSDLSAVLNEAHANAYKETHGVWIDNGFLSMSPTSYGGTRWDLIVSEPNPVERSKAAIMVELPLLLEEGEEESSEQLLSQSWVSRIVSNHYTLEHTASLIRSMIKMPNPVTNDFTSLLNSSKRIIHTPLYQKVWDANEIQHQNIVLVGDASRVMLPSSGQGTAFAIEDATVLANALLNNPPDEHGSFDQALQEYANTRVPRSKKMASMALLAGKLGLGETWYWRLLRFLTAWITKFTSPPGAVGKKPKSSGSWPFNERVRVELRNA